MAKIVLGMAMPHSGMLGKPPETWLEDGERDRRNPHLWFRKQPWSYQDLEETRRSERLDERMTLEERRARGDRCAKALDTLRQVYADNPADIVVIIGKDQKEIFIESTPSLAIFTGDTIENGPPQRAVYAPDRAVTYSGHPELALHLITSLQSDGFDMGEISKWPANVWMNKQPIVPHAYSFVYHQIMGDNPPPSVPVFMNTFYPPNQPSMARCIEFGRAIYRAIKSWDSNKTVAIIGSGGLSHFVCDEEFDRMILNYFKTNNFNELLGVDERLYQSGTSEVKLFMPILVAMADQRYDMTLVDYVPCYRTPAGTGEGMAFMYWAPPRS